MPHQRATNGQHLLLAAGERAAELFLALLRRGTSRRRIQVAGDAVHILAAVAPMSRFSVASGAGRFAPFW